MTRWPDGWERSVGAWTLCLNGNKDGAIQWRGYSIPPFHAAVTFNDWPAGLFSPFGGSIAAGKEANEAKLIQAIQQEVEIQKCDVR